MDEDRIQELVLREDYDAVIAVIKGGICPVFTVIDDIYFLEYVAIIKNIPLKIRLEMLEIILSRGYNDSREFQVEEFVMLERLILYVNGKLVKYQSLAEIGVINDEKIERYSRTLELFRPWTKIIWNE